MNDPRMKIVAAEWMPSELKENIGAWNTATDDLKRDRAAFDARLTELADVSTLTQKNVAARAKAIEAAKVERLALCVRAREQALNALALINAIQDAGCSESARLADASRKRQAAIRKGLADLGITEELAIQKAVFGDTELIGYRTASTRIGTGYPQLIDTFKAALSRVDRRIANLLSSS